MDGDFFHSNLNFAICDPSNLILLAYTLFSVGCTASNDIAYAIQTEAKETHTRSHIYLFI